MTEAAMSENDDDGIYAFRRKDALEYFPAKLTGPLLALPPPGRAELLDFFDSVLMPLVEVQDNDYVVPEVAREDDVFDRDAFDDLIQDLQMMVALLDDAVEADPTRLKQPYSPASPPDAGELEYQSWH
jgi:hypothetical protein